MIKLLLCPNCRKHGYLILHGYLNGYCEFSISKIRRGHRVFCSNRNKMKGCGKTCSVIACWFIKNFSFTTTTLWQIIKGITEGDTIFKLFNKSATDLQLTTFYRIVNRFRSRQSRLRTYLYNINDPPVTTSSNPLFQTITHLESAFPRESCPISEFQHHFQASII